MFHKKLHHDFGRLSEGSGAGDADDVDGEDAGGGDDFRGVDAGGSDDVDGDDGDGEDGGRDGLILDREETRLVQTSAARTHVGPQPFLFKELGNQNTVVIVEYLCDLCLD